MSLHVNYKYLLSKAAQLHSNQALVVLDYGCGGGKVVQEGRRAGIEIYGTDVFYPGDNSKEASRAAGLLGSVVREMKNGIIPFDDNTFDLVCSNQVIEHVSDLDEVLKEIYRVMKPGGVFLSLFPTLECVYEGHIGIPFIHWFSKESKLRVRYVLTLRRLGMGYFKVGKTSRQWTTDQIDWIDRYTHYRTRDDIGQSYARYFTFSFMEEDYINYRLAETGRTVLRHLHQYQLAQSVALLLFRRLAGAVVIAHKPAFSS